MRIPLLLLLSALLLSGCRKKSSPEFFKLESAQSIMVAREGDDAWVSPEMDAILAGLQAIPAEAIEKPRAEVLVATITSEQARVKAAQKPPAPPSEAPTNPFANQPSAPVAPPPSEAQPPPEPVDAGQPTQPWWGMSESEFTTRFGGCFGAGSKATLPDGRAATSYAVNASTDCQKKFGAPGGVISYFFTDKGLWGKATETTEIRDAGLIVYPPPPPPPAPPAPPPVITTPGAPAPEGYEKAP